MRIVAGTLRGRTVEAPAGNDTRPTTDRVREALFSSLYSLRGGFEGAIVLDAFAGSGALGLEALSRGASSAVFYESDPKAAAVVKRNVQNCKLSPSNAAVVQRDVVKAPPTNQRPAFDLVLLDPPYAYDAEVVMAVVRSLHEAGAVADGAVIVYEHAIKSADDVAAAFEGAHVEVDGRKKYGKTGVTIGTMRP